MTVNLYMPFDGKKEWTGILKNFNEKEIILETKKDKETVIGRDKISSIKLSLF